MGGLIDKKTQERSTSPTDPNLTPSVQNNRVQSMSQTDPFLLLKEVVEMSKYMNASGPQKADTSITSAKPSDFQLKCEMNMSNYRAMV